MHRREQSLLRKRKNLRQKERFWVILQSVTLGIFGITTYSKISELRKFLNIGLLNWFKVMLIISVQGMDLSFS